jgi:hypothetical protein
MVSKYVVFMLAISFAMLQSGRAGDRLNIRGMGMARTSVVASRGLDAIGVNPANLGRPGTDLISMTILPVGALLESDFLTYDLYSKYLKTGRSLMDLPTGDRQHLLNSFQGSVGEARADAGVRLFGVNVRLDAAAGMSFSVDYNLVGAATIPRDYVRLLLEGNTPGSEFDINQLALKGYWTRSYAFSYGTALPTPAFMKWISVGATVKLMQGYGYYEVESFDATLRTSDDGTLAGPVAWRARWTSTNSIAHPMSDLFQNPAGYGFGLDVGVSGGLDDNISFGISLTDMGWIKWTRDIEMIASQEDVSGASAESFKSVTAFEEFFGLRERSREAFRQSLPSILRFGIAAQINSRGGANFPGELFLATEYMQGIGSDSPLKEKPRLSFGVEYKPVQWLPIRTGLSLGGGGSTHFSFGLGFYLRSLQIDIATEDIVWLFDQRQFSTGSLGFGIRLVIPNGTSY